jgi:hypothetical protein
MASLNLEDSGKAFFQAGFGNFFAQGTSYKGAAKSKAK